MTTEPGAQLSVNVGNAGVNAGFINVGYVLLLFSTQLLFGRVVMVYGAPQVGTGTSESTTQMDWTQLELVLLELSMADQVTERQEPTATEVLAGKML